MPFRVTHALRRLRACQPIRNRATLCLLLAFAGCGGSSYQQQVERTRQRLAYLDAENELLDAPVLLPDTLPKVFLRPPRGVSRTPEPPGGQPPGGLFHFPWTDRRVPPPPMELLLSVVPRTKDERLDEVIRARVLEWLRAHADEKPLPRQANANGELTVTRWSDSEQSRQPLTYRRLSYQTQEERPLWQAPRRAELPDRCVYNYDLFALETEEHWAIVIFKTLDHTATVEKWKQRGVKAELLLRLPEWEPSVRLVADGASVLSSREACLATLRIGAEAEARLRLGGNAR